MSDKIENAIIFTGGNAPKKHIIPNIPPHIPPDRANCMIIAVDAGCEVCETWGIMPNVIVGDFDSYPLERIHHTFPQAKIYTLHTNKAHTDTEVALMYAHKYSKNITVVGGFGGRIDHFLENIEQFKRPLSPTRLIGDEYHIEKITGSFTIDCVYIANKYISFFPLSPYTKQHTTGLRWNLSDIVLDATHSSISNEHISDTITISMEIGCVLAVWKHTDYIVI